MIAARVLAALACSTITLSAPSTAQTLATHAVAVENLPNGIRASTLTRRISITALTDSIIRVRIARGQSFAEDASWSVPAAVRQKSVPVTVTDDGFRTKAVAVHLDLTTFQVSLTDLSGKMMSTDLPNSVDVEGTGFMLRKALPIDEHVFAMGDKTGVLDRRGYTLTNWNSDTFGYTPSTDPIYKSIPF